MRIEPLANRVVMTLIEENRELKSGLVMPDIAHKNRGLSYGEVIAVGPGRYNTNGELIRVHVNVGDVIMFPTQAAGVIFTEDDEGNEVELLMIPENDIVAKVYGLKRGGAIMGLDGRPLPLDIRPRSHALPDLVYENREGIDRAISDLKQVDAPPDVIDELRTEQVDQREGDREVIEEPTPS